MLYTYLTCSWNFVDGSLVGSPFVFATSLHIHHYSVSLCFCYKQDNEWLTTTCLPALNSLVELFSEYYITVSFLLNELLALLVSCILQGMLFCYELDLVAFCITVVSLCAHLVVFHYLLLHHIDNESLARIGATCFLQLVMTNGPKFDEEMWGLVCASLSQILNKNTPKELLNNDESSNGENQASPASPAPPATPTTSTPEQHASGVSGQANGDTSPRGRKSHDQDGLTRKQTIPIIAKQPNTIYKAIKGKCTVQLGLIEAMNEIAFTHYPNLSTQHLITLVDSFEGCYHFYRDLNNNPLLKAKLAKAGMH